MLPTENLGFWFVDHRSVSLLTLLVITCLCAQFSLWVHFPSLPFFGTGVVVGGSVLGIPAVLSTLCQRQWGDLLSATLGRSLALNVIAYDYGFLS